MLDISWIVSGRTEELVAEANDVHDIHEPKCLLLLSKVLFPVDGFFTLLLLHLLLLLLLPFRLF